MLRVNIRNKNRLVLLEIPGKVPIRGRVSSLFFHEPLDLLLSSLGLCVGGNIIEYCRINDINAAIFEEISVGLEDEVFIIRIKRPKDFKDEDKASIQMTLLSCNVARELSRKIEIQWEFNDTPTEELLIEKPKKCCGE